jgi:hypothetical protein
MEKVRVLCKISSRMDKAAGTAYPSATFYLP